MAALAYDVRFDEQRNRLTTAFRLILAIPHLVVVVGFWGIFAEILGLVQWFIILFTGSAQPGDLEHAVLLPRVLQQGTWAM